MDAGTFRSNGDPGYHGLHVYDYYETTTRAAMRASDGRRHDDDGTECDDT